MDIGYLKMFVEVVCQGSISKAAEKIHISQPALSQQIKVMEQLLNSTLLERSNKGVTLTEAGEVVYKHALQITGSYEKMIEDIAHIKNVNRVLHILSTPVVCDYALPCTLYHMKKNYPTFSLEMSAMPSALVEEKIAYGQGDIGFIVGRPKNTALNSKKVFSDSMHLVAGSDISVPDVIKKEELYNYPFLMLTQSQNTRKLLDIYLREIGIDSQKLKILYSLDSTESIKLSAIRNYGLAFMPYMTIKKELYNKQLRIIEIEDFKLENPFYIIKKQTTERIDPELIKLVQYIEKILTDTIC